MEFPFFFFSGDNLDGNADNAPSLLSVCIMWFLAILIVLTNIPVFIVTPRLKDLSEATKITMISLGITDFLIGVLYVCKLGYFTAVGQYAIQDDYLCLIDGLSFCTVFAVSLTTITFLCTDRVITIKYPLQYPIYFTQKFVICVNIGIWLCSTALTNLGHFVLGMEIAFSKYSYACAPLQKYRDKTALIAITLGFAMPTCVIFTCAVVMYHVVHQQILQIRDVENSAAASQMGSLVSHKKCIRTIFCMVGGYYICWIPYLIFVLIWGYVYGHSVSSTAEGITSWMAISNSMFNSLIYLPTVKEYREIFKNIFIPKICLSETGQNG